jgi:hypothetical protein
VSRRRKLLLADGMHDHKETVSLHPASFAFTTAVRAWDGLDTTPCTNIDVHYPCQDKWKNIVRAIRPFAKYPLSSISLSIAVTITWTVETFRRENLKVSWGSQYRFDSPLSAIIVGSILL